MTTEHKDKKLDELYLFVDNAMKRGRWKLLNRIIKNWHTTDDDQTLGILTATLPAKSKLPSRKALLTKTKERLGEAVCRGL